MIMRFAIGQSFLLVMSGAEKGLFTLGAYEVLNVPLLPQCVDDAVLDWPPTSTANRNTHLHMSGYT